MGQRSGGRDTDDAGSASEAGARQLLTVQEVADELRVSDMTVYRIIKRGELTAVRVGNSYRIRRADLDEYLDAGLVQSEEG